MAACASWLLALLLGAAGAPQAPGPAARPEAEPAADCPARSEALGLWLERLAAEPGPLLASPPQITWPELPGPARWPTGLRGPLVELKLGQTLLDAEPLPGDPAALQDRLQAVLQRYRTLDRLRCRSGKQPGPEPTLLVAADAAEPFGRVARVITAAARAGFGRIGLLFAHPDPHPLKEPGPSSLDGVLAELTASGSAAERTRLLAEAMRRVMSPCPQLVAVFDRLAYRPPAEQAAELATDLPEAVSDCGCRVELPALERLVWFMFYIPPLSALVAPLAAPDEPEPLRLRIPANQPWGQVLTAIRPRLAGRLAPLVFEPVEAAR